MTDSLPTAAEALAAAVAILRAPASTELSVRKAEIWLGIARELRQAADERAKLAVWIPPSYAGETTAQRFDRLKLDADVTGAERKASPEPGAPEPRGPIPPKLDERLRVMRRPADLRFGEPVPAMIPDAQWQAATWQIGDKADCVHCHTPIIYVARRMQDQTRPDEPDTAVLWVHKYTDQRVCMTPDTGDTIVDLDATAVHTFAAPPILGLKG